ncbi:MAG: hypothetical protein ACP5UO_04315 [Thermoplasmata archaeon]
MEEQCDVTGCTRPKFRTIGRRQAEKLFSLSGKGTKVHLCKEHYKEYKKATKKDREVERLTWV